MEQRHKTKRKDYEFESPIRSNARPSADSISADFSSIAFSRPSSFPCTIIVVCSKLTNLETVSNLMSSNYQPLRVLAHTAHDGTITLAQKCGTPKRCVLKKEPTAAAVDYLQREEHILKQLALHSRHPNIIELREAYNCSDGRVLVLDYFEGGDLYTKVETAGSLGEEESLRLFHQLASALQHSHERGIAHRDVTLENCLLNADGDLTLADFGLSTVCETSDECVGKELYIAPECYSSHQIPCDTCATDMWSLGVCLFTMITGVPCCESATQSDKRFRIICDGRLEQMVQAWGLRALFSDSAMDLVQKLLTPDPDIRITIEEVLAHACLSSFTRIDTIISSPADHSSVMMDTIPTTPRPTLRIPVMEPEVGPCTFASNVTTGRTHQPQRPMMMNNTLKVVTNTITITAKQKQRATKRTAAAAAATSVECGVTTRAQARCRAA